MALNRSHREQGQAHLLASMSREVVVTMDEAAKCSKYFRDVSGLPVATTDVRQVALATTTPRERFHQLFNQFCQEHEKTGSHQEEAYGDPPDPPGLEVAPKANRKRGGSHNRKKLDAGHGGKDQELPVAVPGTSSSHQKLTELETLYLKLKRKHPDVILLLETGYLFRFFAEDAQVASEVLNLRLSAGRNLRTTSVPRYTVDVHVRCLVAHGLKVGMVRKTETSLTRQPGSAIFRRELTDVYTEATMLDEEACEERLNLGEDLSKYLVCFCQVPAPNERVRIGLLAVSPTTGDVVHDSFTDGSLRTELECRFVHLAPVEVLVQQSAATSTGGTGRFLDAVAKGVVTGRKVQVELVADEQFDWTEALRTLRQQSGGIRPEVLADLDPQVVRCLAVVLGHLRQFGLDRVSDLMSGARQFTVHSQHVYLDTMTTRHLELFRASGGDGHDGSLLWALDRTVTAFGSRMLKKWISQPLRSTRKIQQRLEAVTELVSGRTAAEIVRKILRNLPDVEGGVVAIYHKKCNARRFLRTLLVLERVRSDLAIVRSAIQSSVSSPLLRKLLTSTETHLTGVVALLEGLDHGAAWKNRKTELFKDLTEFPAAALVSQEIAQVRQKLEDLLPALRKFLGVEQFQYASFNGNQYVVPLDATTTRRLPPKWVTIACSKTKVYCRSPEVNLLATRLRKLEDHFEFVCNLAWQQFLEKFQAFFQPCRQAVTNLATLDCLHSFAAVSCEGDFVRPCIADGDRKFVRIEGGFHPVTRRLGRTCIPNDARLGDGAPSCLVLSGANMGGKSFYVRQVALVALMAQMGCYVPARSVTMTPLDAIYFRSSSGSADSIMSGRSSFYAEAEHVSAALRSATSASLVVLDEFGRCTDESDGAALAHASIRFLVDDIRCLVVAVTHYAAVMKLEEELPVDVVGNFHVSVMLEEEATSGGDERQANLTYLYEVAPGTDRKCHALNVMRLAGMDWDTIQVAARKSKEVELNCLARRKLRRLWWSGSSEDLVSCISDLQSDNFR